MKEGTILTLLKFPHPWPPQDEVEIFSQHQNNLYVRLIADINGRLGLQIQSSIDTREYWFQPIVIEGSGLARLIFDWWPQGASMRLNSQDILLYDTAQGEVLVLKSKEDQLLTEGLIIGDIDFSMVKSKAEEFFLNTVVDIDHKVEESSRYSLIRATGLLRQLFIDSTPLVHVVNRTHHQKIEFETLNSYDQPPLPLDAYAWDLDGHLLPSAEKIISNLKNFLKTPCFMMSEKTATVRDLIRACANAKGGVHLGITKTEEEGLILDWDRIFRLLGKEPSLRTIAGICRISLRALKPLVNAIVNSAK